MKTIMKTFLFTKINLREEKKTPSGLNIDNTRMCLCVCGLSMIHVNPLKSIKIYENPWKSIQIHENNHPKPSKSMKIFENQ